MKNIRSRYSLILLAFMILAICAGCARIEDSRTIKVALKWEETPAIGIWQGFYSDEAEIAKALEKYPTKFPAPLPDGGQIVMFYPGRVFGILQKPAGKPYVTLALDVDGDRDLTNNAPIEVPIVDDWKKGVTVKIARSFATPTAHTEWLPYHLFYRERKGPDGKISGILYVSMKYSYKGEFEYNGKDYFVTLHDGDMGGRFIREKQVNVSIRVGQKADLDKPNSAPSHRLFELIPIGDKLYEIKAIAEDGSWIEFAASNLPTTAIGTRAPDISMTDTSGKTFRISDYRGKVLVLDFWYVWCKPCIAKFPAIKKMIESYSDKPLAAIGVNIDVPERVEQAKKVIADNQLTWRQVVEGKGEFLPVYQVYGRLPENPMSFPIYVAIDELGFTRYSTNDFQKMGRFLESHFRDPKDPEAVLFIPCQDYFSPPTAPRPTIKVDFTSEKVKDRIQSGRLKMPSNLPKEARIGLLPNRIALIAFASNAPENAQLIVDSNGDADLTNEQRYDIPIINEPNPDISKMANVEIEVHWMSGGIAFFDMATYAKSEGIGGPIEVYGLGWTTRYEGEFYVGKGRYAIEFADVNGDRLLTEDDWNSPGFLKLKIKKGDKWIGVHEGTTGIPIQGSLYRLRYVSDEGALVELERQK